jgi:hypothetical protein
MIGSDILSRLDTDGASITESANAEWYWIAVTRYHEGHRYSHSVRIDKNPTYEQIENARETFKLWWAETIKEQIP